MVATYWGRLLGHKHVTHGKLGNCPNRLSTILNDIDNRLLAYKRPPSHWIFWWFDFWFLLSWSAKKFVRFLSGVNIETSSKARFCRLPKLIGTSTFSSWTSIRCVGTGPGSLGLTMNSRQRYSVDWFDKTKPVTHRARVKAKVIKIILIMFVFAMYAWYSKTYSAALARDHHWGRTFLL